MSTGNEFICDNNSENTTNKLSEAEDEWEGVPAIVPKSDGNNIVDVKLEEAKNEELILFNEAWQYFQMRDMREYMQKSRPTLEWSAISHVMRYLCGPPTLLPSLIKERNLIFAIAACPLINTEDVQVKVLKTIYRRLCNNTFNIPLHGRHWEDIGFQGNNPATDLRGVGFLGLMNLLYIVMCPATFPLARRIFKLSQHETQHFPFVLMSLNITAIVLKVLREERINGICNKRKQVVGVVNDLYVAAFRHVFLRWKKEQKTISHSGFILKEVDSYARKQPARLLHELEAFINAGNISQSIAPTSQSRKLTCNENSEFSVLFSECNSALQMSQTKNQTV